jgi:3-methyl-2-oxobutanoate hydroxymethyltransferase
MSDSHRVTLRTLRQWVQQRRRFAMLTCYDATTAGWLWRGGVRTLLVGDTAAQVILGHDSTLPAKMRFMLEITAAVRRGAPDAFVMADMPFGSYQAGDDRAVRNAVRFVQDAGADAVKLEVDASHAPLVQRLSRAGVPVVAHVGSRPQQVRAKGGYTAEGRTRAQAMRIIDDAGLMLESGAAMVLIEAVPNEVSIEVVKLAEKRSPVAPVIGCGAGAACHGHVVVLQDLLGMTPWQPPFAPPMANVGERIADAARTWAQKIDRGEYLRDDHPYKMVD